MTNRYLAARLWAMIFIGILAPAAVLAAPFAAYVMDARTGKPVYAQNADTPLHPASLTKMMTLYIAFAAVERGQVRLDSKFPITSNAAAEPPSKLGLKAGQKIELRYLIRAAAIKSANDAATAIGEGLAGSEPAFAAQMTATARALGMRNTQFRNANGLTQQGHYSTAHDMSILGRRLFYDFPQYYSLFSRRSADAGIAQVHSTNKQFLDNYPGADGIKTGYTRAAGFNLTASAQRGNKRIVATVFGGTSTAQRNQMMGQLMDAGFGRAPQRVREVRPEPVTLVDTRVVRRAQVEPKPVATSPQPQRLVLAASAPPAQRRSSAQASTVPAGDALTAALAGAAQQPAPKPEADSKPGIALASSARPLQRPGSAVAAAPADPAPAAVAVASAGGLSSSARPPAAPRTRTAAVAAAVESASQARANSAGSASTAAVLASAPAPIEEGSNDGNDTDLTLAESTAPRPRSETVILAAMGEGDISEPAALEVVTRSSGGSRAFGVSLGRFRTRAAADQVLLEAALQGGDALASARRHVADTARGWQAEMTGMTRNDARATCERLMARQQNCTVTGG